MEEQIDVLMATYNGEKFVKEQIESILNQTYKNIRLIISDDCSKDNTVSILKEYEKKDNRVKIYLQPENLGVVKNIEFLLNKVQSNLFMLSDQDDVWLPEKIEKSVETLKKEDADLVFGDLEVVDENLNIIHESFGDYMLLNKKIKKYIRTYKINYLYNCVTGCTLLCKTKFIKEILPLPSTSKYLIHDHWIALIVSLNGKLAYISEKYIKYRQHGNNEIGAKKVSHKMTNFLDIRKLFIDVKLGLFGEYVKYNEKFPENLQELNQKSLEYFKMIENKNNFNLKKWGVFHELYRTEKFMYYVENFIILNAPFLGKFLFKIRYKILKLMKKR